MGLFTGLSETKIAKSMLERTNSFIGSYDLLKNAIVGTGNKSLEFVGHVDNTYEMSKIQLVEIESIANALGVSTNDYDEESCEVWDISTPLSLSAHGIDEYGDVGLKYKYTEDSTTGAFSLVRLSKISKKNNYINIKYDGSITMRMGKPTIFIVLDDPNFDGEIFNFIVNIKFEALTNTYTSDHIPSVIFIDGRYSNISLDSESSYIVIDGIKYNHIDKKDYIRDRPLELDIKSGTGYSKYSRDYYDASLDKYKSGLISNESFLISIGRKGQIFNNVEDEFSFNFMPFNIKNYSDYGIFNDKKISTYSTDDTFFTLLTKDAITKHDALVVSTTSARGFRISSNSTSTHVFGKHTNKTTYDYDNINISNKLSQYELPVIHCEDDFPKQFNILNNTPFDSLDSALRFRFTIDVERKNAVNSIGNINIIKTGLKGTKYSFVIAIGATSSRYYFDGISSDIHQISLTYANPILVEVRFKSDLNKIYARAYFTTPIDGNIHFEYDSGWTYLCETSDIVADNWNNYIEIITIKKGTITETYDNTTVTNISISNNLSREIINTYSNRQLTYNMAYDFDDAKVDFNRKILSLDDINGFLLKIEPNYVVTIPTDSLPTVEQLSFTETTYKASFIYNKNKGDFLYEQSKNYKLITDKLSANKMSSTTYEGNSKCTMLENKIGFSDIGVIDILSGNSYYTENIEPNSFSSTLYSGNRLWGMNTTINNSHCGEVATVVKNPARTEIQKKVNTYFAGDSDILIYNNTGSLSLVDSTYTLLRHFEGTSTNKTNVIVESGGGITKEYDRKITNIGTNLLFNFHSYTLSPEEEAYFERTSAQMNDYITATGNSKVWKSRSIETHVDFEYYFTDDPTTYLTESELDTFVSGGITMIAVPYGHVWPWSARAGIEYDSEYFDGTGCKYGTTIMTKPMSYKWNGTTDPYYNVNTTQIYVAYDGTIVTGSKQVNSQTVNADGSYTNIYKTYSLMEYTDPATNMTYPGVTTIMYQDFNKNKEAVGGHYYQYFPNHMVYRVDSVKFSIMNGREHLGGWHGNTLTRLSFDGSNAKFLEAGNDGCVNVYVGNTAKIGHKLKLKSAKITPQYCALYLEKLVTIDTGYSTVYKKLDAEKVPTPTKLKANYNTTIDYKTLESEYVSEYQDSTTLKEGWKLFNYYQYPSSYVSNVTK